MFKINFFILVLYAIITFSTLSIQSQTLSTKSKKAINFYDLAMRSIDGYDYSGAITLLQEAVKIDSAFTEAWLLMADAYDFMGNFEKSAMACEKALSVGGNKYPITYYFCAQAYFRIGKYQPSIEMVEQFLAKGKFTSNQKEEAEKIKHRAKFSIRAIQNPVPFELNNFGENINSEYDEYWPSLSADEEILVFTRLIPKKNEKSDFWGDKQEDIFYSKSVNNQWQLAIPLSSNINTFQNEGSQSITSDGKQMYFTACNRSDGKGKCDIYISELTPEGWSIPRNLGYPINTGASEKQPSVSADGRTLYFVSDRMGGKGKFDIYVSHKIDATTWSNPINLGDSINTPDDEQSPFIHADGQTLFFSSNGWIGLGGYDIFRTCKKDTNDINWSSPFNLGYPINTCADEIGFVVNARGNRAFFASDRNLGKGKDIFEFELYEKVRPQVVSYMKGKVFDAETKKPLNATFELINLTTKLTTYKSNANFQGEFLICLPTQRNYALNVSHPGYLFYSENFSFNDTATATDPIKKNIALQPIKPGKIVILNNIFFETNSFELKEESIVEIEKVAQFLKNNPNIKIEISGHTDNVGNEKFNLILSEKRAKAVRDFLISKNIDEKRIYYKGYGMNKPITDNNTESGKALNRRTEFKIIE